MSEEKGFYEVRIERLVVLGDILIVCCVILSAK